MEMLEEQIEERIKAGIRQKCRHGGYQTRSTENSLLTAWKS